MRSQLFRKEAVEAKAFSSFGSVRLAQTLSTVTLTVTCTLLGFMLAIFVCCAKIYKPIKVAGYLISMNKDAGSDASESNRSLEIPSTPIRFGFLVPAYVTISLSPSEEISIEIRSGDQKPVKIVGVVKKVIVATGEPTSFVRMLQKDEMSKGGKTSPKTIYQVDILPLQCFKCFTDLQRLQKPIYAEALLLNSKTIFEWAFKNI